MILQGSGGEKIKFVYDDEDPLWKKIGKVYAGRNGIIGALTEDLIDVSQEVVDGINRGESHIGDVVRDLARDGTCTCAAHDSSERAHLHFLGLFSQRLWT